MSPYCAKLALRLAEVNAEKHFFYLFPDTDDEPPSPNVLGAAVPSVMPAVLLALSAPPVPAALAPTAANNPAHVHFQPQSAEVPIDAIELSDS